jgi:hypothetical protein
MVVKPEQPEEEETIEGRQGKVYHNLVELYIDREELEKAEKIGYEAKHFFYNSGFDRRFDLAVIQANLAYIKSEQREWLDAMDYGHSGESLCESLLDDCEEPACAEPFLGIFIAAFDYYLLAVNEGGFEYEDGLTMDYAIDIILNFTEDDPSRLEKTFFAGVRREELNKKHMADIWEKHLYAMHKDLNDSEED